MPTFAQGTSVFGSEIDYAEISSNGKSQIVPVGTILAWVKTLTNTPALPDNWVECNGQTINDAASVYNGVAMPSLNTTNRFLMGNATSGATGGSVSLSTGTSSALAGRADGGTNTPHDNHTHSITDGRPPYYTIVWIIKIK